MCQGVTIEPTWSINELLMSPAGTTPDIQEADLLRLATLSGLKIPQDRVPSLCHDMNQMNSFVAAIKRVDVSQVTTPTSAANVDFPLRTRADDGPDSAVGAKTTLDNASLKRTPFFVVPNAMERE